MPKESIKYIFTTESFDVNFGGLTAAMFKRANAFLNHFEKNINILSFTYKPNIIEIKRYLSDNNYIRTGIDYFNMYESLSKYNFNSKKSSETQEKYVLENNHIKINYDEYITYHDSEGKVTKCEYILNEKNIQTREYTNGKAKRYRFFENGDLKKEVYFREDGTIYLVKMFFRDKKCEIILLNIKGMVVQRFYNHKELRTFWLKKFIDKNKQNVIINDHREIDDLILDFESEKTSKIFMIHSTHLREPYHTYSELRSGNRYLLKNIGQADGIVFLTDMQKNDITERYGKRQTIHVIPHFIERVEQLYNKTENRFVVISRYHEEKRIDHIIKAFQNVKEKGSIFTLDIFGSGKEKERLRKLINECGLTDEIQLHDFTNKPNAEFKKSIGTFLTSKYEGFGLTILESLNNYCPVFAYNIKYGPSDMIEDNYNGYLIKAGKITELADRIHMYLQLPSNERNKMFENARISTLKFSEEEYMNKWNTVIENAIYYSNYRYTVLDKDLLEDKILNVGLLNKGLNIQISIENNKEINKFLLGKVGEFCIEINDIKWSMELIKESKFKKIYEITIPFEDLKKTLYHDIESIIYYYTKVDDINYRYKLKFVLHGTEKDNKKSTLKKVFYLKNSNGIVKIGTEEINDIRSYVKYLKYL